MKSWKARAKRLLFVMML